jgi:CHAT domain-containing protein
MHEEARVLTGYLPGLLSGLVCAGANAPAEERRDDGYLTAEEVEGLDLSKVDLVVLSACETGLGVARSGEGMLGLRRAFRQAGARTVISSLWSVRDESTTRLMQAFYERLWVKEQGTLESLRGAQLEMLRGNRAKYDGEGMPSTWGAFVLDGDWR